MLKEITEKWKIVKDCKRKKAIKGSKHLYVQYCLDRKNPTLKLFSGVGFIELNEQDVEALKNFLNETQ